MWTAFRRRRSGLTIASVLAQIDELSDRPLSATGLWTPYSIFTHCAQSVEYSILGYPEQQPKIFQKTVGKLAFSLFSIKGHMTHPLDEPIPGAPELEAEGSNEKALARLRNAYVEFGQYAGSLAPHFTYGALTKEEYTVAHVMHFTNHLEELHWDPA